MKFFDGLYGYEIVLLVLGALFFLVLIIAFVVQLLRGKPYSKLLAFFVIPLVMIGFPGIKSVQIGSSVIDLEEHTRALQENPDDKRLREALTREVANVAARPLQNPEAVATLASAQFALGDQRAAEASADKALQAAPGLPTALEVKGRIELDRKLATLTAEVARNPADATARAKLATTASEVGALKVASPETITNVARAQELLGDETRANASVDKALRINPNFAPALQLKERISTARVPTDANNP